MAPAPVVATRSPKSQNSGSGITITSVSVKKGNPTVIKYTWKYHKDSPDVFTVALADVVTGDDLNIIADDVKTRDHGEDGKGSATVSIADWKDFPGKYQLVFVDYGIYGAVYARSKTFQIKKTDF